MALIVGNLIKRKLLDCPVGFHYGAIAKDPRFYNKCVIEKLKNGSIRWASLGEFAEGQEIVVEKSRQDTPLRIYQRAIQVVHERKPWDLFSNCEHLARWVVCGEHNSHQVQIGIMLSLVGVAILTKETGT